MYLPSYSPTRSPMLHPALSTSLSRSFGLNSPFSLSALSSSLTQLSSSPGFSSMGMSLGRSFEERPKLEAQFFRNFSCCGLDLQDLHGLLEHFEECHVAFDEEGAGDNGPEFGMDMDDGASETTVSGPPSPRMGSAPRGVFEVKKSALSSFDTPPSPATATLHLDPSMELDMEMDDTEHIPATSLPSASAVSTGYQAPSMSAFESQLSLQGSASKKKFATAMNAHPLHRGMGTGAFGQGLLGLDALQAARATSGYSTPESSIPGTPIMEEVPGGGVDGIFSVPASASTQGGGTVSLAPSLLFPNTPADSPPSDGEEADNEEMHEELQREPSLPLQQPPPPPTIKSRSPSAGAPKHHHQQHQPVVERSPADLPDVKNIPASVLAALGPNSLAALPTALHPLGTGVQISPSGRPYTPPSEKPFKCSVVGCDKSYKQQNGLKYHRLHGHCNQNATGKDGGERGEGKPYVCHVASCGKRYKK